MSGAAIPAEAVEAAARAIYAAEEYPRLYEHSWDTYREKARAALEAAAPYLMAPRVVTTQDELDALPLNTIILDAEELPLYKDDSDRVEVWCFGDNEVPVNLPARVLYLPNV